jgi:hypothetical protein
MTGPQKYQNPLYIAGTTEHTSTILVAGPSVDETPTGRTRLLLWVNCHAGIVSRGSPAIFEGSNPAAKLGRVTKGTGLFFL